MSDRNCDILLLSDMFEDARAVDVIGSFATDGTLRRGADVESVLSIDHAALRIEPLLKPGWARAGLSYGPYTRQAGLAFAALIVNGHNTSQSGPLGQTFGGRLKRWMLSSASRHQSKKGLAGALSKSLARRVTKPRTDLWRRFRWWWELARTRDETYKDNLAVGWFASEAPSDPLSDGHAFAMTALGSENGELRLSSGKTLLSVISRVQNLPIYYVAVLREQGAAYYVASVEGAPGFAAYPYLRPVGIASYGDDPHVYAGVFQSVMGEIGFHANTRVQGIRAAQLAQFRRWFGSAQAADLLTNAGGLEGQAEIGGCWQVHSGGFTCGQHGAFPTGEGFASLRPASPSGLIHVFAKSQSAHGRAGIAWRAGDDRNYWLLSVDGDGCCLSLIEAGTRLPIAATHDRRIEPDVLHTLQVLDDGSTFRCFLDGRMLFGAPICDERCREHVGVGVQAEGDIALRSFEAHPRQIPMPAILEIGKTWTQAGEAVVLYDPLSGSGEELSGSDSGRGGKTWQRSLGEGVFHRCENGAMVAASTDRPNPGRTLYTIDCDCSDFADVAVTMTPPGSCMGQGHMGRGGLVFWQDRENYVVVSVWLDDVFNGSASVSSFFRLEGYEEIYDAVWTNVGRRIQWGIPFDLRVQCDGMHYRVYVDGEPVLQRALSDVYADATRLMINRVGVAANWEWGDDTGTSFKDFVVRV